MHHDPGTVLGDSVASWMEVDLDRAGVVHEPDDVGATRGRVRGVPRRDVRWSAMSDLAEPQEAVTCLVPDVCPVGEGGGAEIAKPKVAGDQGVAGGKEELALRSGELAVCGADAHLAVEAVGVDRADANAVIDDGRQLGGELLTIVGEERYRAPPEGDVLVEQDVGSSGDHEVLCRDSEHVGPAAETVGK